MILDYKVVIFFINEYESKFIIFKCLWTNGTVQSEI